VGQGGKMGTVPVIVLCWRGSRGGHIIGLRTWGGTMELRLFATGWEDGPKVASHILRSLVRG